MEEKLRRELDVYQFYLETVICGGCPGKNGDFSVIRSIIRYVMKSLRHGAKIMWSNIHGINAKSAAMAIITIRAARRIVDLKASACAQKSMASGLSLTLSVTVNYRNPRF